MGQHNYFVKGASATYFITILFKLYTRLLDSDSLNPAIANSPLLIGEDMNGAERGISSKHIKSLDPIFLVVKALNNCASFVLM
jgi:hypothetical protein